jgi:hypothetical protein
MVGQAEADGLSFTVTQGAVGAGAGAGMDVGDEGDDDTLVDTMVVEGTEVADAVDAGDTFLHLLPKGTTGDTIDFCVSYRYFVYLKMRTSTVAFVVTPDTSVGDLIKSVVGVCGGGVQTLLFYRDGKSMCVYVCVCVCVCVFMCGCVCVCILV